MAKTAGTMVDDRPRYYREFNGRAFWAPNRFGVDYGFRQSVPLGPAGPEAKKAAIDWNTRLDNAREKKRAGEQAVLALWKPGSLGSFFEQHLKQTDFWALLEPRSREDYERAWPTISERFGDRIVTHIRPSDSERFHVDLHPAHRNNRDPKGRMKLSWNEAHRTLKVWRALLQALVDYRLIPAPAPVGRVSNPAPKGRSQVWLADEVESLVEAAGWAGMVGMGVAIRIAWDAMLSPVDVRLLPISGWRDLGDGGEVRTLRAKTKAPVLHAVTPRTAAMVRAYLDWMKAHGDPLDADAPLIRRVAERSGRGKLKPFSKDPFEKAFKKLRTACFGPDDQRSMLDMRRSGATEARMGGVDLDDLGRSMANTIDKSEALQSTYLAGASRNVLEARERGRAPMKAKFRKPAE